MEYYPEGEAKYPKHSYESITHQTSHMWRVFDPLNSAFVSHRTVNDPSRLNFNFKSTVHIFALIEDRASDTDEMEYFIETLLGNVLYDKCVVAHVHVQRVYMFVWF